MRPWQSVVALVGVLGATACGMTSRHTLGPTVDSQGHFGVRFAGAIGPLLRPRRDLAIPFRLAAGVTAVERKVELQGEAALAFESNVGVDWNVLGAEPSATAARVGARAGWLRLGDRDAWTVGLVGALTAPVRGNLFSLGVEGGCDALLGAEGDDPPVLRCDLGLVFDITLRTALPDAPPP
ncbi:MAG: hypothetical protein R3B48_12590 [Kofleriaceae bacterium]